MWSSVCEMFAKNPDDQTEEKPIPSVMVRIGKIFWLIIFAILVMMITGMWIMSE